MSWQGLQDEWHNSVQSYDKSPHARPGLANDLINRSLRIAIRDRLSSKGGCRVLDLGAGHGRFTDHMLALGASVVATEMSTGSAHLLKDKYQYNSHASVVHDPSGEAAFNLGTFDVVCCISLLHHVPDYLGLLNGLLRVVAPDGWLLSFQDPTRYSTRPVGTVFADRVSYYGWRVTRGELRRGVRSVLRRTRGKLDPAEPSDMVEYHVVRDGVDEEAVIALLRPHFTQADLVKYWSSHASCLESVGRLGIVNTFGAVGSGRRGPC